MMSDKIRNGANLSSQNGSTKNEVYNFYWGLNLGAIVCENCDWRFFHTNKNSISCCPYCYSHKLTWLDQEELSHLITHTPELYVPFSANQDIVNQGIYNFIKSIKFAPKDLSLQNLQNRLLCLYFPNWLVDVEVEAIWEAELGYDYQVVSHRERYDQNSGRWTTQEITETRTRWEQRVGRLKRAYHNIRAPGMEDDAKLIQRIGRYDSKKGKQYDNSVISDSFVSLPSRSTEDAWPAAIPPVQSAASSECLQAASADHIRQFRWKPTYDNHKWSLLLLPIYTSYYMDDDNIPQVVYLNGQSGRLYGDRKASMKSARRSSLIIVVVAMAIFLLSLVVALGSLVLPPLIILGGIGILLSMLLVVMAIIPVGIVWQFNRREKQ
jgi:hypothetical protein